MRAVDKQGNTIDFLLTAKRNKKASWRYLITAIGHNGQATLINIDKRGADTAAIKAFNQIHNTEIEIRQCQYLNSLIKQDHRGIKRIVRPMMGFKNFHSAQKTLAGIELMRMLRKGQMKSTAGGDQPPVEQFYTLAA